MTSAAIMRFGRFALALVWLFGKGTFQGDGAEATAPVHAVDGTYVKDWLVLGPFLSQDLSADLLALINEILDLSKIESGRMELAVVDFDLRDLISGTAVMFEPRCRQKGLQWRIEWNVAADGSPRSTDSKISGVTSAAFSRTQFLVRGDEGKLRLESELGRGSRFRFALHLLPALGEVAPKSKRTEGRVRRLQDGVVVRALAAADIVENQHVLEHFLMDLGVEVTMAAGGEEAWTQLCAKRYGIAFLDIQMPGMTGIDIANRVVKEFGPGHVKLVAISASVLSHEQQQDAEIGFDGFVPKPFRFEHLCECLENLLGVKFEYEAEPTGTAEQRSLEGMAGLTLPPDLLDRLRHAAEMDSVTEFDGSLWSAAAGRSFRFRSFAGGRMSPNASAGPLGSPQCGFSMSNQDQIELVGAKVLMVDDIPANLQVLRGVLEPCGFRILFAPRGDVALRVARSELPDLILLDVMMPEMDGLEVCRRLKLDPATAEIPVIFITAKDEVEDVVKGLRAGGVDNEIRTPMNSVLGMTALLLETLLAAEQRDFVETIQTSSRSLRGIINEILDFSKIESGRMTLESQPFDLTAAVEEALDILGNKAAEKQLDLAYLPERDLPATLVGDVTRFRQILLNLAGNALKFTARGEVVITAARERSEGSGAEAPVISLRILLADDHAVNQRVGSRILLGFGYRCEIAGNGLEVIEALERQPFDIVFLDVQMPQQDGYETARQIRKRWSEAERPRLIAITANAFQGDREKCLEAGMDHYIAKPVEIADIWKALERWGAPRGHARPESSDAEAGSPAASRQTVGSAEAAPDEMIDWTRFHEMLGDDSATVREFLNLYYSQASAQIENLDAALKSANASEVEMLAHKCKGASATCGLNAMVRPMAELERAARSGDLSSGGKLLAEAQASHDRVREILSIRLRSLEAPSEQRNKGNL